MRRVENKKLNIPVSRTLWDEKGIAEHVSSSKDTNYFDLYIKAANIAPDSGWTSVSHEDLFKRLELKKVFQTEAEVVLIEEDQYTLLVECLKKLTILGTSEDVYEFLTYLGGLEKLAPAVQEEVKA